MTTFFVLAAGVEVEVDLQKKVDGFPISIKKSSLLPL
jgi:hypothetical protein